METFVTEPPNAGGEPRLEAEARYERTLEGVGSSAWLGSAMVSDAGLSRLGHTAPET
jgi:hypothetical protein